MPGFVSIKHDQSRINWATQDITGHTGLSDYGIMLIVWYIVAVAVVWSSILSERQLWLLAVQSN